MATLTRTAVLARLGEGDPKRRLVITPILDVDVQVSGVGVDLRLGNQFLMPRRTNANSYNPCVRLDGEFPHRILQRTVVPFRSGKPLYVHPGSLVLAGTFEYLALPEDLEAQVEGRSSWARLGVMIATATTVDPGYKGILTLEISNVGTLPVALWPGSRIARLVLRNAEPPLPYDDRSRKYYAGVGPEYSRLSRDKELAYWGSADMPDSDGV